MSRVFFGVRPFRSLFQILIFAFLMSFAATGAWAQDGDDEDQEEDATSEELAGVEDTDLDRIVVTGSRLQRETYTSISPLQIITAQGSREAGLIDSAEILQKSTASAGQQIDISFQGFVLDNGPGASTVDLRGLGANRTLVLLNGRRLSPAGVEGAPFAPDLNLVPAGLVDRYEVLLDGASSIYGSDAVAGVTNIIMRKDFDGLEFDVFWNEPDHDNGAQLTANAVYGMNFDRGVFGFGVEYVEQDQIRLRDRPWTAGCSQHHEITETGEIRFQEQFYNTVFGMEWDECRLGAVASRVFVPFAGSIYYTPGFTNGGWPNFSESNQQGFGVDGDGDGQTDLTFRDYDLNGSEAQQNSSFWPGSERISVMGYGEYVFESDANHTLYGEFNFNDRDFEANAGPLQFFPVVPANNPFNLCNPNAEGGVDCGTAWNDLQTNPNYIAQFQNRYGGFCASVGLPLEACVPAAFGIGSGPIGPAAVQPIVSVANDRGIVSTTMEQIRGVVGMRGDLLFVDWGSMNNWVYDMALSYTTSDGTSSRPGIRDDRTNLALGAYSSTNTPCENDLGVPLAADAASGCVPVNMFAPSLYPTGNSVTGDFATAGERNYLFDSRDFDTEYQQTLFTAYANGFLFNLPGGTALGGIGVEWREDKIKSLPDEVARDGLLFGFFSDEGATGAKDTTEAFAEIELPLLAGRVGAEEVTINLSGRYTDDEFYGDDFTYSAKLGWRPVSSLLLRATYGTSFRAPNVRETFMEGQSGFNNSLVDPCIIPDSAIDEITGGYNPALDQRSPILLENCRRTGADPTMLDNNGFQVWPTEIFRGKAAGVLLPETSESYTYGFAFEQPWWEGFDLTFGASYYEIDIDDTIIEPSSQFVLNQCLNDPEFDSNFCEDVSRGPDGFIDFIDARFQNRDNAKARGIDFNVNYDQDINFGATPVRMAAELLVNRDLEASTTFVDENGNTNFDDDSGNIYFPEWKGQLSLRADIHDVRVTWVVNYRGSTEQADGVDPFDDLFGTVAGFLSDTCFGPPDDVLCRDYADTDDYWLHSASVYYYGDVITIGAGVRNVFDEEPPRIDGTEFIAQNNVPLGAGYDLFGRTYFVNLRWTPNWRP